ncbi:MAG: DUF4230 domain-containing protein [Muribaculaceae bacterium]|nr:DUF4230 domain-containing protein [Muribaculaceae bacterium]
MRRIQIVLWLILVLALAVGGLVLWQRWSSSPAPERVRYYPARVSDIRSMVELQTVEIYEEMPFKAAVGGRHLVGKIALEGHIGFDLEKVALSEQGDTLAVTLPSATVTLRESTEPGSYIVYDTWSDNPAKPKSFTAAEENKAKRQLLQLAARNLHKSGAVKRAGTNAARTVAEMLSAATGRPVKCTLAPDN